MIKFIITNILGLLILTGCNSNEREPAPIHFGTEKFDSTALHIALVPNKESLPIYYAVHTGLYKKIGLNLQVASYLSQLDCDTALLGRMADGGMIDHTRLQSYGKRADHLSVAWAKNTPLQIYSCQTLRIRNIKNLQGRTIGTVRNSSEAQAIRQALQRAGIPIEDVYLPQINNQKLRAEMLTGNQIDAAVLSWPYTILAQSLNHHAIYTFKDSIPNICFVRNREHNTARIQKQWDLFEQGRKMAMDSLKIYGNRAYASILQKEYGLPQAIADTIKF